MKIGVFYLGKYYVAHLESAFVALARRGHHLVLLSEKGRAGRVPEALARTGRVEAAVLPRAHEDGLQDAVRLVRTVRDVVRFHDPRLVGAYANRARAERRLASLLTSPEEREEHLSTLFLGSTERETLARALLAVEALVPADSALVDAIRRHRLDLALVISRANIGGGQDDIVKAARAAGTPSFLVVYSWDNLTNKGLLHVAPDRLAVWNAVQEREAAELHGIDPETIVAVGAPRFDPFFEATPSSSREALLVERGLDPARPTVLYLGSSNFVAPREPEFIERWLAAVRGDAGLAGVNVVIRPHPSATKVSPAWSRWQPPNDEATAYVPGVIRTQGQDLYDQLFMCDAVVGLNTSAEIEAAILGRPVLTVRAGAFAPGQEGSTHYRYLLSSEGGPVEEADGLEDHCRQLSRALVPNEAAAERRRAFAAGFIRPRGLDRAAGEVLADEVEVLGGARRSLHSRRWWWVLPRRDASRAGRDRVPDSAHG